MIKIYEPKITNEDISFVTETLKKGWLSGNTPVIKDFEEALANYLGIKYVSSCSSGTAALHLSLLGLGIGPGDEVIMPSLSYIATANAVSYVGATPVFIDVDISTWQIDHRLVEKKITKNTKAIMPVHLYGGVPDLKSIQKIAKKYKVKIIRDSAEALGSKYNNQNSTNFNDVSILSFFPNKVITTGEGGAVCTNNKKLYDSIEKFKSHSLKGSVEYLHSDIGYNYRMSSMSASIGFPQIKRIDDYVSKKKLLYEEYKTELEPIGFEFQNFDSASESSYWLIATKVPKNISRNKLKKYLFNNQVETRNVFIPLHLQPPYKHLLNNDSFENSIEISNRGICLPSSPGLNKKDFNFVVNTIKNF